MGYFIGCRFPLLRFSIRGADERRGVFGIEWIPTNRLLPSGTKGDIHAPIVGQDDGLQVFNIFWRSSASEFWILVHLLFYLFGIQILLFTEGPSINRARPFVKPQRALRFVGLLNRLVDRLFS